jgi:serine/threonine-protein kinase
MERIGRYQVRQELTVSVFARLVLAVDEPLDRLVVIKTFAVDPVRPEPPFTWAEWRRRFIMEGRIQARLTHPNLLGILDSGVLDDGRPYHVLPFMPANLPRLIGLDLDAAEMAEATEIERPRAMPPAAAMALLGHLFAALAHLRTQDIVHRDIKPANILLTRRDNGMAKLCDFGMAKISGSRDIQPGAWIGTLDYISPEQHEDAGSVTDRSDVYSVGAVAWRMLTGRLPGRLPPPLASFMPDLPQRLADLVTACLERHPERRPSAQQALRHLLSIGRAEAR